MRTRFHLFTNHQPTYPRLHKAIGSAPVSRVKVHCCNSWRGRLDLGWDQGLDKTGVAYKIAAAAGDRIRVIAGPGTGKSYAMKRRVARLLEEQIPPDKVLAVTFTRVAAEDLHRELQKLDVPGCENLRAKPSMGSPCAYSRASMY